MTEPTNSPERQETVSEEIKVQKEAIRIARAEIEAKFGELRKKMPTPLANSVSNALMLACTNPLNVIEAEMEGAISVNDGQLGTEQLADFKKRKDQAVDFAKSYLERMSRESGGITPEVLVRMVHDVNRKASRFADLLIKAGGKENDLVEAFGAVLKFQGKSSDLPEAEEKAIPTIIKHLKTDFEKGENGTLPLIWTIMSFMSEEMQKKVCKIYFAESKKSPQEITAFLKAGNTMGVFSAKTIQELTPKDIKFSETEIAQFQENWKIQNDFRAQAMRLIVPSYGTENAAGKMLTIKNLLFTFAKLAAGATIVGNFMTGAWEGGKFGLGKGIGRLTNTPSLVAAGVIGAITIAESNQSVGELIKGEDPQRDATIALRKEINGNPSWHQWDSMFKHKDFEGARVFSDYIAYMRKAYDNVEVEKLRKQLTSASFVKFLEDMETRQKSGKTVKTKTDYAGLRRAFTDTRSKDEDLFTFAKIFDALNIGESTAGDSYNAAIKATEAESGVAGDTVKTEVTTS